MQRNDFYRYKLVGLKKNLYKKFYYEIELKNYFHFFSVNKSVNKYVNKNLHNSFNNLGCKYRMFDYFNVYSSSLGKNLGIDKFQIKLVLYNFFFNNYSNLRR